ncbi:hypothetical protein SAY86_021550 [Trapa natans]|uniref:CASP-like protein n=1 Tax=Trapa natans TaxID=22666 RepID=A0AAN7RLS4_TRANT|nr:hypothetical protein SAY86_021550 [Trapa natans]
MSNPEAAFPEDPAKSSSPVTEVPPTDGAAGLGVSGIVRRWRRDDLVRRGSLALRGLALIFCLLSFLIMATNRHGGWENFDKYEEFRYLLAIAILAIMYTGFQALRHFFQIAAGIHMFQHPTSSLVDFSGDQVMAYFLMSAASAAVPKTNFFREDVDNLFTDSLAASISMAFLAFFCLAFSALISGT